ncbi:uncharacterized protein LOC129749505 [Uranotaenia lowii]|uniref:uncharacterized protein LOC129749505 n=1 Tax=Uranotaenia lowii TaxID=190385 RepID=UPI00247A2A25|nr:uncharacterized protein LOC129749505 [Uranotaenia lowii]XP_055600455.1 uncharacterized protein LOC129749505 [Uranotaenia lowii]
MDAVRAQHDITLLCESRPWNEHQLASVTSNCCIEGVSLDSLPFSSANIVSVLDMAQHEPEELNHSVLKEQRYNIIQSKLNLEEKRGPKYRCLECTFTLPTRLSMVTHMKGHLKPFCEVCFETLKSKDAVHRHMTVTHPEVVARDCTTPPMKDYYYLQTIVPPNTPNTAIPDDEMTVINGLVNPIIKVPVNPIGAQKFFGPDDTDGVSTEDEHRLVIDDAPRPKSNRAKSKKKNATKQTRKLKPSPSIKNQLKSRVNTMETNDNILKITSRFGRSISLKVPQY